MTDVDDLTAALKAAGCDESMLMMFAARLVAGDTVERAAEMVQRLREEEESDGNL